jgi:hypothetical protein
MGDDKKLGFLTKHLGFHEGFNYENVGGEHLETAINALQNHGQVVACSMGHERDWIC